jgi:hypothetical protein
MPLGATIEDRLTAVETAVAEIRGHLLIQPPDPYWLEQVIGSFKDEPAFDEVLAYGRAFRKGELPVEDIDPRKGFSGCKSNRAN